MVIKVKNSQKSLKSVAFILEQASLYVFCLTGN